MEVRIFLVGAGRVMSDRRPPPYLSEHFKQPQERPTSRARPSGPRLCLAGRECVPSDNQRLGPGSLCSGGGVLGPLNKDSRLSFLSPPNPGSLPERDRLSSSVSLP